MLCLDFGGDGGVGWGRDSFLFPVQSRTPGTGFWHAWQTDCCSMQYPRRKQFIDFSPTRAYPASKPDKIQNNQACKLESGVQKMRVIRGVLDQSPCCEAYTPTRTVRVPLIEVIKPDPSDIRLRLWKRSKYLTKTNGLTTRYSYVGTSARANCFR